MKNLKIKTAAIIIKNGKVLLIKEKNTDDNKYYLNLVKGTFEPQKDRNLTDAIIRECKEEINIQIKIKNIINVIYYRKNNKIRLQFNFLCSGPIEKSFLTDVEKQQSRGEDIIEIRLFTKTQILKMKESEFMNKRAFIALNDFVNGKSAPFSVLKEITES